MTDSSLDLSARADLDWLAELISDANRAAPSVSWLVVGALARDLHLSHAHGIRVDRVTTDTDLALTIATWTEFAQVRQALIASGRFVADRRAEHKLLHHSGRALDVVPFGDIEDRNRSIAWPPSGAVTMSVLGYREAFAGSIALQLPRGQQALTPSIAGLIVLKFIAWSERHRNAPGKDAYDLRMMLTHYLDAGNLQRLYEHHLDLVDADFDYSLASARVAGRDASRLLERHGDSSQRVRKQLNNVLRAEVAPEGRRALIGQSGARDAEQFRLQVAAFMQGLMEGSRA
ncbi:nucleotidyl transferase AbiEii/AbiGii toxin family protein [Steroidobacter sp.]|uniref:nucleotidyl transferase AbiEii/AbiGii toxin family protein n=1 Tax=Steroidobacter sp. TaxID=1978227 RepID=UPI001A6093A5|nr:nucleotidyl transferase AbiEii/AbiGii toxin family protein [Steroidobacter sp.]MBL8271086.1 nucleotidyl transferase AbiEii/AbiGii toxin family protein [Steroidobacter sp.]